MLSEKKCTISRSNIKRLECPHNNCETWLCVYYDSGEGKSRKISTFKSLAQQNMVNIYNNESFDQ